MHTIVYLSVTGSHGKRSPRQWYISHIHSLLALEPKTPPPTKPSQIDGLTSTARHHSLIKITVFNVRSELQHEETASCKLYFDQYFIRENINMNSFHPELPKPNLKQSINHLRVNYPQPIFWSFHPVNIIAGRVWQS